VLYEGVPLDECPACRGCYVMTDQMTRIFARDDYEFSESVKRLAKTIPSVSSAARVTQGFRSIPSNRQLKDRRCPSCGSAVVRKFYTEAYLVEVEQCWVCGLAWLDKGELELLQYLYEDREAEGPKA
jgi:Zn-finger nucleic acid-binding protein